MAGARRGVTLLTHAMMANAVYLGRFARFAAGLGVETWALDFRGHGRSVPPSPRTQSWGFDAYVEADLPAAVSVVCATSGVPPDELSYVGHSLGGLVGLAAFGTGGVPAPRRLSLVAVSVWRPGPRGPFARRAAGLAFSALSAAVGYLPVRVLRLGTDDEPRGYAAQFATWARTGTWSSCTGRDYLAGLPSLRCPTLAFVADGDRLCNEDDVRDLTDRLGTEARIRRVGGAHGDPCESDHFGFFVRDELASTLWPEWVDFLAGGEDVRRSPE